MQTEAMGRVLDILDRIYPYHPMADITQRDPFKVLISCLLTLRSRDVVTLPVCRKLCVIAETPQQLLDIPKESLIELIKPVQFYNNKAEILRGVCRELLTRFDGQVPERLEDLESLKGVGRKTANLVLQLGFDQPAICVDTHVHRICNRLGYIKTKDAEATEAVLSQKLPVHYWNVINRVMVRHGQEICVANHPKCDLCPVFELCERVDVIPRKSRSALKAVHEVFLPQS